MIHDLNPVLLSIYGDIGIRYYGLAYLMGFVFSYFFILWLTKRQDMGMNQQMVSDFITYGAFGVLIGGRLGYAVFYSPDLFFRFKSAFPFWGVLAVNEGGMASHGGMIGLVAACLIFAKKYKFSSLYLFDLVAISGPVGIFFGRIANFINGELVGRPVDGSIAWGVKFPSDILQWPQTQINKVKELGDIASLIPGMTKQAWLEAAEQFSYQDSARKTIYQGLEQIILLIQSGHTEIKTQLGAFLLERHPSQLYEALGEGLILFLILFLVWSKPRQPGVISSLFVILYAIARIVTEQFRMPDAHIGYQLWGLTRGQWLSIVMLFVGFVLFFLWSRQTAKKNPGWLKAKSIKVHKRYGL